MSWLIIKIKNNFFPHNCYMNYHFSITLKKNVVIKLTLIPTSLWIKLIQNKNLPLFPSLFNPHLPALRKNGTSQSTVTISKILQTKIKISENLSNNNPGITPTFSLSASFCNGILKPTITVPKFVVHHLVGTT